MRKLLPLLVLLSACSREDAGPSPPASREPAPPPAPPPELRITFETPAEWKQEQPSSKMRKAQYAVPDKDKAEGDATFIYFGAMGGGVKENIDRWKGQFRNPPSDPREEQIKAGDMTITVFDIAGEYASDMGADSRPDQRGLFAIVPMDSGNHIFRLTGPRGTVGDWRDAFVELLRKIRARGG